MALSHGICYIKQNHNSKFKYSPCEEQKGLLSATSEKTTLGSHTVAEEESVPLRTAAVLRDAKMKKVSFVRA